MSDKCYLENYVTCKGGTEYVEVSIERLSKASKKRRDDLCEKLDMDQKTVQCHKACVSTYTSKNHIKRLLEKSTDIDTEPPTKRTSRNNKDEECEVFCFKRHCIFCGKVCLQGEHSHMVQ